MNRLSRSLIAHRSPCGSFHLKDGSARDIRNAFKATLDMKTYKIESDDEEDVFVKTRKSPDFAIELVESTVKGTRVNLDRE